MEYKESTRATERMGSENECDKNKECNESTGAQLRLDSLQGKYEKKKKRHQDVLAVCFYTEVHKQMRQPPADR
jgi:hypothetical protein